MIKKIAKFIGGIISLLFLMSFSASAGVAVYAEGAYTDTELAVYIYADVTDPIVSYGIKLTYDTTQIVYASAEKNEDVWYFGSPGVGSLETPNANPVVTEDASTGQVVIVGGKLDESAPTEGVTGDRKLMVIVKFTRMDDSIPFSIGLELGKGGDYANFVQVDGVELDAGVPFGPNVIHQRGDVNGDGAIDFQDMLAIKFYTQNGGTFHCYSDCNEDDTLDFQDMLCIKNKTQ